MAAGKIDLQSVEAEYASALEELTFEHKTVIESLTTIAQETVDGAVAIVSAIEDRIRLVGSQRSTISFSRNEDSFLLCPGSH
jgi:hypothetical protein